jgi:putative ABC transport system permease protein
MFASFLFGVDARDPKVFVAIPVLLTFVALAGVWLPAIRASRIDPLQALRYE